MYVFFYKGHNCHHPASWPPSALQRGIPVPRTIPCPPPCKSQWSSSKLLLGWSERVRDMGIRAPPESQKALVWRVSLSNTRPIIWQSGNHSEAPFWLESPLGLPWKLYGWFHVRAYVSVYLAKVCKNVGQYYYCSVSLGEKKSSGQHGQKVFCLRSFDRAQKPPT